MKEANEVFISNKKKVIYFEKLEYYLHDTLQ